MSNDGSNILCYWGSGSAPSWRVLICIAEKKLIKANLKLLSMSDKEHKASDVLAINPRGQVPTFKDGAVIINESIGICQYLAETYADQGTDLLPKNKKDYALVLQRIHEIQNLYIRGITLSRYYWKKKPHYTEEIVNKKKIELIDELNLWESYLDNDFLAGTNFSLADACLFPVIAYMERLGFDLSQLSNISKFYQLHKKRDSIKNSWPPHWKESKNKTIFKDLKI